jgi:hypothetical protein
MNDGIGAGGTLVGADGCVRLQAEATTTTTSTNRRFVDGSILLMLHLPLRSLLLFQCSAPSSWRPPSLGTGTMTVPSP